jgi:hypothetical protein
MVDATLNSARPDAEKIASADMIARYRASAQRENISEKEVALWVFASNGSVIGNQGNAIPTGDGSTGFIRSSSQHRSRVVRRKFKSITYLDAEARQPLVPFFAALRLPSPVGPGLVWDPRDGLSAEAAIEMLNRRTAIAERETLTELVPVEPFVRQTDSTGWGPYFLSKQARHTLKQRHAELAGKIESNRKSGDKLRALAIASQMSNQRGQPYRRSREWPLGAGRCPSSKSGVGARADVACWISQFRV